MGPEEAASHSHVLGSRQCWGHIESGHIPFAPRQPPPPPPRGSHVDHLPRDSDPLQVEYFQEMHTGP